MISEKNVRNWEYRRWVENFRKNGENIKFKIFLNCPRENDDTRSLEIP